LDNRGDGIYLHGEAKVVVEEEEEWMNVYEELCQHIGGQPEQARRILANRESDTLKTESNNYPSAVIVETIDENINASKKEQIDTPAVEGAAPVTLKNRSTLLLKLTKALRTTRKR